MSTNHLLIYLAGLALVLLLLGMIGVKKHLIHDDNPYAVENFELPDRSSSQDVSEGASSLYGWGYNPLKSDDSSEENTINENTINEIIYPSEKRKRRCPKCDNIYIDRIDLISPSTKNVCRDCDITKNKDIDKYVLKSSIPPCPNMSEYALKNQLPPAGFNPDEWIKKSDIPPCPTVPNMNDYILRSEVPPCDLQKECPKCPECPVCPTCPPCEQPKVKIVEKIVYKDRPKKKNYMPQSLGENYPQSGAIWRPKLSNSNSGFISPDIPMAGNAWMNRRFQELAPLQR
jgi:hypothetical protein